MIAIFPVQLYFCGIVSWRGVAWGSISGCICCWPFSKVRFFWRKRKNYERDSMGFSEGLTLRNFVEKSGLTFFDKSCWRKRTQPSQRKGKSCIPKTISRSLWCTTLWATNFRPSRRASWRPRWCLFLKKQIQGSGSSMFFFKFLVAVKKAKFFVCFFSFFSFFFS